MLMRSEVEIRAEDWENALKTLEQAFDLPGVKDGTLIIDPTEKKYSLPFG